VAEEWLGRWTTNLILVGVTTRCFGRVVRLPEGNVPAGSGSGGSQSAASRWFVAPRPVPDLRPAVERLAAWLEQDLPVA
jgi:hypothetical protein